MTKKSPGSENNFLGSCGVCITLKTGKRPLYHWTHHKPFCLPEDFHVTVPSWISVLVSAVRSSLRNSWPSFSRPWDFGSRRRLISLRRASFSYSRTWSFTWEMASLMSDKPCTRDWYSSVSAERNIHALTWSVFIYTHEKHNVWDFIHLPSVFCMIRSTRMGYFVMRWVTNMKHSGIPNLRTRGSWPIFWKKGFVFQKVQNSYSANGLIGLIKQQIIFG